MTWFRNTRYGSLSGSHAQITHMMWGQSVHVIQKSGMQAFCGCTVLADAAMDIE